MPRNMSWASPTTKTDMSVGLVSHPRVPLWAQIGEWILAVFARAGIRADMGAKLYPSFIEAGLPGPRMRCFQTVGGGMDCRPLYRHYCDRVRGILPSSKNTALPPEKKSRSTQCPGGWKTPSLPAAPKFFQGPGARHGLI